MLYRANTLGGLVPGHLHRHALRHASPHQLAHGRPSEVVRNTARASRGRARGLPRLCECGDRLAGPMEDITAITASFFRLRRVRIRPLCASAPRGALRSSETAGPHRSSWFPRPAECSGGEVHLMPLQGEHFGRHAPARDVRELDQSAERLRQMTLERFKLLPLEEPRARGGFWSIAICGRFRSLPDCTAREKHRFSTWSSRSISAFETRSVTRVRSGTARAVPSLALTEYARCVIVVSVWRCAT